jgi:hypothetical protein
VCAQRGSGLSPLWDAPQPVAEFLCAMAVTRHMRLYVCNQRLLLWAATRYAARGNVVAAECCCAGRAGTGSCRVTRQSSAV